MKRVWSSVTLVAIVLLAGIFGFAGQAAAVSSGSVSLGSSTPGAATNYTVSFYTPQEVWNNYISKGIVLTFPNEVNIASVNSSDVTVNGCTVWSQYFVNSGHTIKLAGACWSNPNTTVYVSFKNNKVINPATGGTYTIGISVLDQSETTSATFTIGSPAPSITVGNVSGMYGGQVSLNATVTAGGTPVANRSVSFQVDGQPFGSATTSANGYAQIPYPIKLSPGAHLVTATYNDGQNPPATASGTLTVAPAPLTVTADDMTRPFGVANPTFTYTVSGLQAGDQVSALSAQPMCSTSATAASPVGTYAINCTGAASPNYTISYVAGTLSVTQGVTSTTPANVETALGAPTVTLTAKVAADGIPVQEGTVTFTVTWGPHSLTTDAVAVVNGTAQVTVKLDGVGTGTWQVQAVYTAGPNYTGSSGASTLKGSPKGSLKP
jgi:hypothetical protein